MVEKKLTASEWGRAMQAKRKKKTGGFASPEVQKKIHEDRKKKAKNVPAEI